MNSFYWEKGNKDNAKMKKQTQNVLKSNEKEKNPGGVKEKVKIRILSGEQQIIKTRKGKMKDKRK